MNIIAKLLLGLSASLAIQACASTSTGSGDTSASAATRDKVEKASVPTDPFPSTYTPMASSTMLITDATIYDGLGGMIENGDVLITDGKITEIGQDITAPASVDTFIDGTGKFVTPGIIDIHSHLGVYPSPGISAHGDGNEVSAPVTAEVWAEHSVWPQDPGFSRASAGGVTSLLVLPGSANLFGGRGVTLKNVPARTVQEMKFPDAPYTLKMACGENPKRVYGYGKGGFPGGAPFSRMGNVAGYRTAWAKAAEYKEKWEKYEKDFSAYEVGDKDDAPTPPSRDLELDTLKGVLDGDILVQMHCYRADEMAQIIDMSKEFGYKVTAFHHGVEAYKIADLLAEEGVCGALWADWWGIKAEAYDGIRENIPMVHAAPNGCAIVHSDSEYGIQRLNQEAAKALADGQKAGLNITKPEAWTWLSRNPAKAMGILDKTGTLEAGKAADVVIWSGEPFSVYTQAEMTLVDGAVIYDRDDPAKRPVSDFELGQPGEGDAK